MKTGISKENIEFGVDLWRRIRGNALRRNAGYLVLAAIAAQSNLVQYLIAAGFSLTGAKIALPETPTWIAAVFVAFAGILLVVDRLSPEKGVLHEAENPTAVRQRHQNHKQQLMSFYVEAGELLNAFNDPLSMRSAFNRKAIQDADAFTVRVSDWITKNIGAAARARFLDLGSEGGEQDASEWKLKLRRQNLARLIESENWG